MKVNTRLTIEQGDLKSFYQQYRDYIMPIGITSGIILVCIFLFFNYIMPQISNYFTIRDQIQQNRDKLQILKQNLQTVQQTDEKQLDDNLHLTLAALPQQKDFEGVINAITKAVGVSGLTLADYSFQVGNVATNAAVLGASPSLQLSLNLGGDIANVQQFITILQQQLPLSSIDSIRFENGQSTIKVNFYYKNLPQVTFQNDTILKLPSKQDMDTLTQLSSWQTGIAPEVTSSPTTSQSATLSAH